MAISVEVATTGRPTKLCQRADNRRRRNPLAAGRPADCWLASGYSVVRSLVKRFRFVFPSIGLSTFSSVVLGPNRPAGWLAGSAQGRTLEPRWLELALRPKLPAGVFRQADDKCIVPRFARLLGLKLWPSWPATDFSNTSERAKDAVLCIKLAVVG